MDTYALVKATGKGNTLIKGWLKVTWDVQAQRATLEKKTETTNKGVWIAVCHGFDLLFWNGRFIRAGNKDPENEQVFRLLVNIMAHPRKRAEFLSVLDALCYEEGTKYV